MECFAGAAVSNAGAVPEGPRIANSRASGKAGEADFEGLSEARGAASSDRASNSMCFNRRTPDNCIKLWNPTVHDWSYVFDSNSASIVHSYHMMVPQEPSVSLHKNVHSVMFAFRSLIMVLQEPLVLCNKTMLSVAFGVRNHMMVPQDPSLLIDSFTKFEHFSNCVVSGSISWFLRIHPFW